MSEALARADRRELRKAFGPQAVSLVDESVQRLRALQVIMEQQRRELGLVASRVDAVEGSLKVFTQDSTPHLRTAQRLAQSLRARLHWLVTGR